MHKIYHRNSKSFQKKSLGADGQLLFPASAIAEFLLVWRGPTLTKLWSLQSATCGGVASCRPSMQYLKIQKLIALFVCHLQWKLANDQWFWNYSTTAGFLIFVLVFVSHDFKLWGNPAASPSTQKVFLKYRLYRNSEYNDEYSESDESHVLTSENMKW